MKRISLIFILGLMPLLPCSSHFAYALLMAAEIWLLFFASLLAKVISSFLVIKTKIGKEIFENLFVVATSIIFSLMASLLFPITELSLRFYIYLTAVSYILVLSVDEYIKAYQSFSLCGFYTAFFLGFAFLRELLFFGSISFLTTTDLFLLKIIPDKFLIFSFLGTNAGAFFLLAFLMWIYYSIKKEEIIPFVED